MVEDAVIQICNGLGAGNIGDELMARAFWDGLPDRLHLEVEVLPNVSLLREPYPAQHAYRQLDWDGAPPLEAPAQPGLLVGDTPVSESLGVRWPLQFLAPRLAAFHRAGQPVDALGVGVESLHSDEARALFRRDYLPMRSWTVRTPACREALLELGVHEQDVAVGADWAWLYRPRRDLRDWAARAWSDLGIDPRRPLVVANVINEIWRDDEQPKSALAAALDAIASREHAQIAFFCQEMREGEFFDLAAARETAARMARPAVIVPNLYYSPDEVLGLLAHAEVTLGGRYHFVIASVLAGSVPVCVTRSEKTDGLLADLQIQTAGRIETVSAEALTTAIAAAIRDRTALRERLAVTRRGLESRARANLGFWNRHNDVH
jgi:polysaccharide pyruvyl transferase WcaK-like protein